VSLLSINMNNAYAGGFSLLNIFPKLGRAQATAWIGFLATILCLFPTVIDNARFYIAILGSLFAPLVGVIIVDYVWIKKMKINIDTLT
jgi:purine-cytosine permease-like protein